MKKQKVSPSTFLNIGVNNPLHYKFIFKNALFTIAWTLGILLIIFRIDLFVSDYFPNSFKWISNLVPFAYLSIIIIIMLLQKWYYNLALIFYPVLIIFWFLPKFILSKGKIYLFISYLNFVWARIKKLRSFLFHSGLFFFTVFLVLTSDLNGIRIFSIVVFSYLYFRYVFNYIRSSFHPPELFNSAIESTLIKYLESPAEKNEIVKRFEERSSEKKLSEEEKKHKQLERLIILNYGFDYLGQSLNGIKGKRAFIIAWILQLFLFISISLVYLTFINFELYVIDNDNFSVSIIPNFFHFLYYALKSMTFNNIDFIKPVSVLAICIEIYTFLLFGIFIFVFAISIIFSWKLDRINENIKKATDFCVKQNQMIAQYIEDKYQTDIQTAIREISNIQKSLGELKNIIDRIF